MIREGLRSSEDIRDGHEKLERHSSRTGVMRSMAGLVAAGTMAVLLATLNDYGMAWDEGFTVEREERLREWFARVSRRPHFR